MKKPFSAAKYVDRTGTWHAPVGLRIPIKIIGARSVFGRVELHVTPVHGEGKAWVKLPYVKLREPHCKVCGHTADDPVTDCEHKPGEKHGPIIKGECSPCRRGRIALEKERKNYLGRLRGYGGCLRCEDSWSWKESHNTGYGPLITQIPTMFIQVEPTITVENIDYTEQPRVEINGRGCFPLCEECWSSLTPEQRLPFYDALVDLWERQTPRPMEDYEKQRLLIHEAVMEGK